MKLYFGDIIIKKKQLIQNGFIDINSCGISVITGKNGCGKTLLLKNIFCDARNKNISKVFIDQNNENILTNKDVLHNISMSSDEEYNNKIKQSIQQYGFDYLLEHNTTKLSGGEKRVVNLLRGILSQEKLLLIDEHTNDLDNKTVQNIICLLQEISKYKCILIITHDDRLTSIVNYKFKIDKKQLQIIQTEEKPINNENEIVIQSSQRIEKDLRFSKKVFPMNFVSLLFALAFIAITVFQVINYQKDEVPAPTYINDNQINIYHHSISVGLELFNGVYPIPSVDLIYETNPIKQVEKLENIQNLLKKNNSKTSAFNIDLQSTDDWTVYPFEFFDVAEKRVYYTLDLYLEKYYNTTWEKCVVDTSALFVSPRETFTEKPTVPIDREKFLECAAILSNTIANSGKKLELTCAVIVLNDGVGFEKFYKSEQFQKLALNEDVMIATNEIKDMVFAINCFKNLSEKTIIILLTGLGIVILDNLFLIYLLTLNKRKIFILKDFSFDKYSVMEAVKKKLNCRYMKLLIAFAFVIFNITFYINKTFTFANYLFSICILIIFCFGYWLSNKIIDYRTNKFFKWSAR